MKSVRNIIIGGIAGNVVEWYDFALYAFMIPFLSQVFFSGSDSNLHKFLLMASFCLGFLARPIGALLYGYYGDTRGRKDSLLMGVLLMVLPTFCIGLLPSYHIAGYLSATLLVIIRLIQGITAAGEFGGSVVFCLEHAPKDKHGFYSALPMTAAMLGVTLGSLLPMLMRFMFTSQQVIAWAWRIPFLLSFVFASLAYLIRRTVQETPVFIALKKKQEVLANPVNFALRRQWREIIQVSFIVAFGGIVNYMILIHMPGYLSGQHILGMKQASLYGFYSLATVVVFTLLFGALSDKVNRKALMVSIILITLLICWPLSQMLMSRLQSQILIALICFSVLEGCYFGAMMAHLGEIFPAKIRFTSLNLGYNLGFAFFAGFGPVLVVALLQHLVPSFAYSFTIFLAGVVSLVGVLLS